MKPSETPRRVVPATDRGQSLSAARSTPGHPRPEGGRPTSAAKPERADKARNRARILEAAGAVFADKGVGAQMDEIAASAGLGVGTLYRHFATKDALLVAMVERKFELILEVTQRAVDHGRGAPFDVFATALREGAEVASVDAATQDVLLQIGDTIWNEVIPTLTELNTATQVLVDRAHAAGTLRSDVSAEDIPMIMCGISAAMAVPKWDWRRYLDFVLDGLRAPNSG